MENTAVEIGFEGQVGFWNRNKIQEDLQRQTGGEGLGRTIARKDALRGLLRNEVEEEDCYYKILKLRLQRCFFLFLKVVKS